MSDPFGIERSRRELAAARLLAEESFASQAISRAEHFVDVVDAWLSKKEGGPGR